MYGNLNLITSGNFSVEVESDMEMWRKATAIFLRYYRGGLLSRIWSRLTGKRLSLPVYQAAQNGRKLVCRSVVTVPISEIIGTAGRTQDFDADFAPLKAHNQDRWVGIAVARRKGIPLPPVELLQGEGGYYVQDGHHRVSVARAMGQQYIEARIMN